MPMFYSFGRGLTPRFYFIYLLISIYLLTSSVAGEEYPEMYLKLISRALSQKVFARRRASMFNNIPCFGACIEKSFTSRKKETIMLKQSNPKKTGF